MKATPLLRAKSLMRCMERRPWLCAAVYLLVVAAWSFCVAIDFANMCPSRYRFMPVLSDEAIVAWATVGERLVGLMHVLLAVMIIAPIVMFLVRRRGTAFLMLVFGVGAATIGTLAQDAMPLGVVFLSSRRLHLARLNLKLKEQALREGRPDYERHDLPMLEQHVWRFHDNRFALEQDYGGAGGLALVDDRWQPSRRRKGEWHGRLLLGNVVKWQESGDRLYVITGRGEKYVLDYESAEISPYPYSNASFSQNGTEDRIFAAVEQRPSYDRKSDSFYVERTGGVK